MDHIKPVSKFPKLRLAESNLQVLCEDCNMGKSAWDETDWRKSCDLSVKSRLGHEILPARVKTKAGADEAELL